MPSQPKFTLHFFVFSFSIAIKLQLHKLIFDAHSDVAILKQQNPAVGWYKLLTAEEGEFYNVPVPDEGTDLVQLKSQMRVSK